MAIPVQRKLFSRAPAASRKFRFRKGRPTLILRPITQPQRSIPDALAQKLAQASVRNTFFDRTRVAKLADAPDLGLRNHRFHKRAFHFKEVRAFIGKNAISRTFPKFATGE